MPGLTSSQLLDLPEQLLENSQINARFSALDDKTQAHSFGVAILTAEVMASLDSPEESKIAVAGALLHDLGKAIIDKGILDKDSTLTEEEWEYIRIHPLASYVSIKSIQEHDNEAEFCDKEWDQVAVLALTHHCHKRRNAYPTIMHMETAQQFGADFKKICDPQILLEGIKSDLGKLIAHVDMFEVFAAHKRSYLKKRLQKENADFDNLSSSNLAVRQETIRRLIIGELQPDALDTDLLNYLVINHTRLEDHARLVATHSPARSTR